MNENLTEEPGKSSEEQPTSSENETNNGVNKDFKKALEDINNKAEENRNQYLRACADMENVRRRAEVDVQNAHKYGIERFGREMVAVIDSLEHGLQVADSVKDKAYHEGMELTLKLSLDIFEKFGIKRIEPAVGDPYDALRHEAIAAQPHPEMEANKIMAVVQKGFILHDRVLRPARVIVTRKE